MKGQPIATSHGKIVVEDHGGPGIPMLLIHGNSTSRHVFSRQMKSPLQDLCRLIRFDLPGHGESEYARDPHRTYTLSGFADVVVEVLGTLGIERVIVLGWSLGGHIAVELLSRLESIEGLVLTGAPPIRRGGFAEGFVQSQHFALASRRHLSPAEVEQFGQAIFGRAVGPRLRHAIARADGRCRERLFEAGRAGEGVDQRATVEASCVPIAVINGATDPLVNLDYIDGVAFPNLWRARCHRLQAGHAAFWQAAPAFNELVAHFVEDVVSKQMRRI
jgi:pimeloyl-ACP methyl ester carboxylesterase